MKILFVINTFNVGGAEHHLVDLCAWLNGRDVETVFAVREGSPFQDHVRRMKFPSYGITRKGAGKVFAPFQLAHVIAREKPDVLSVNREHDIFLAESALALAWPFAGRRPKRVAIFHTPTGRYHPLLRCLDGIVCTSEYTAAALKRTNAGIGNGIRVIHYGIPPFPVDAETKRNRNRPRRFFRKRGFPIIGMVGELWKNQEELVDVAKLVVREVPGLTVAVVGGGYQRQFDALNERIRRCGLEGNFVLTGRVDRERIPDIFHDFDLSVSTHRNEGFGIVHIESLAGFTPVVAYNAGGYVEMLRHGGGVLIDGGVEAFAREIVDLVQNDARRCALAVEGRRIFEMRFTRERMGEDHLDYYRRLVGG